MKLPFTRDAASLLQKEIAAEAAATAKLADMRGTRASALLDDDIAVIERHDADIAALERQISIHQDRILALDARLHAEEAAERERRHLADIAAIERTLEPRRVAAAELEGAMLAVASAVRKFRDANSAIVAAWPAAVEKPSYHISLRRLGECIRNAYSHPSLVFPGARGPMPATDFVRRTCDSDERISGFADREAQDHIELLQELRNRGAAPIAVTDDPEEQAA